MHKWIFVFSLLIQLPIFGQSPNGSPAVLEEELSHKMRTAEIAFEALQEDQADEIYQEFLEAKLLPWQDSLIRYNSGITTLPTKDWPGAIGRFGSLHDSVLFPPPLEEKVLINLAYAILQQTLEKRQTSKASFPLEDAIYNLKEALHLLQTGVGDNCCPSLFQTIQLKLSEFLKIQANEKFAKLSLQQRFLSIDEWVTMGRKQLKSLSKLQEAGFEKKAGEIIQFLNFQAGLWNVPQEQIAELKNFDKAKENYLGAIQDLEKQDLANAQQKLSKSHSYIHGIQKQLKPLDLKGELARVAEEFEDAISLSYMTKSMQERLHQQVSDLAKKFSHESQGDSLSQVRAAILLDNIALELMQEGNETASNYYTKAAFQRLLRAQQDLEENVSSPKYHLKVAISEQKNALDLVTFISKMQEDDSPSRAMITFASEVQKAACSVAEHFTTVSIAYQNQLFHGDDKSKQCQERPWNELFPLFYKGLTTCKTSEIKLAKSPFMFIEVVFYQKKTLEYWQKALALLEESEKPPSSSKSQSTPPPSKQGPETENMERMIQMLIEMDMEDESSQKQNKQLKPEERPW